MNVDGLNLKILSGFKTSAYKYDNVCTLVVDNCFKFMSTNTVLNLFNEIFDHVESEYPEATEKQRI